MPRERSASRGIAMPASWPMAKRLCGCFAIGLLLASEASFAASPEEYKYRVEDGLYGSIGTYRYVIEKTQGGTTMTTEAHIEVSLFNVTLYSQDVSRIERQVGDRLIYFHGITTENGKPVEVDGRADGGRFVVNSPSGRVVAPGTIRTANPWSAALPGADTVLMPDTGVVAKVRTSGGEETSVTMDGIPVRVRRYQVETLDGRERYQVWMSDRQTPVMFNMRDAESNVTFTLIK